MNPAALLQFIDAPPVATAWGLAPEEALEFLKGKGLRTSFDYRDLAADEHARAFTIAKMMDADLLADVKASLDDALANGVPFKEWADKLVPELQAKGWWGRKPVLDPKTGQVIVAGLGSPARLATIYRSNIQSAYAAGAWEAIKANEDTAPYLLYDAVDDFRTRPEHAAWDNTVLPVGDPWWATHYPPNGWNCRCSVIQLSADEVTALGLAPAAAAPKEKPVTVVNPRTRKRQKIPHGIDPGWQTNAGEDRARVLRQTMETKLAGYAPAVAKAAAIGFRKAIDAGKAAAKAEPRTTAAANLGHAARTTTRVAGKLASAAVDEALAAGGPLAKEIRALLRTKAGQAMTAAVLLETAAARVQAARDAARSDLDGFD